MVLSITKKYLNYLFLLIFLISASMFCQEQKPDSAQNIIKTSVSKCSKNKKVLVVFHASWNAWCRWLDSALESPEIKPIMEKYFLVAKIHVKEFGKNSQTIENPGGQSLMKELGGKSELPFIAVLDKKGKMVANSNLLPKKQNIGYPGSQEEIAAFIKLIKKTAPKITKKHINTISKYLNRNAPL
ncbi:MAG: thioredoxin family protein [Bacteroidetes bacterium]|nr:thioredoxin family protein [Bacteroidota bacterium]